MTGVDLLKRGNPSMASKATAYKVVNLTPGRRVWLNLLDLPGERNSMFGLLEVDVTLARQLIGEHKARTGETLSFTGYLVGCLGRAVEENKELQAYPKGRHQVVLFDDVDVAMMIEHEAEGKKVLMGYVLRRANHKTYREINDEIRSVQKASPSPGKGIPSWLHAVMLWPRPISTLIKVFIRWLGRHNPTIITSMGGTVSISSVGMFGEGHSGWGIYPLASEMLGLLVGSISWKLREVEGRIEPRQMLNLTISFDHERLDGALTARFTQRLVELIESGYGLKESGESEL
jgi:hypothetical protein